MQRFSLLLNQTPLVYTMKFFFALICPQSSVQTAFWLASVIFSKLALGSSVGFWSAVTFLLWPCHPCHCCLVLRHTLGLFVGRQTTAVNKSSVLDLKSGSKWINGVQTLIVCFASSLWVFEILPHLRDMWYRIIFNKNLLYFPLNLFTWVSIFRNQMTKKKSTNFAF